MNAAIHLDPTRTALLVVDVQKGFFTHDERSGPRSNLDGIANIARLIAAFRAARVPVVHVRHNSVEPASPFRPELPGNAVMDEAREIAGEWVVAKSVNSAFIGTDLEQRLRGAGIASLVICGATANHCVETTARMADNLGFAVALVGDAVWAYGQTGPDGVRHSAASVHAMTLANIAGEFGRVTTTHDIIAALTAPAPIGA